MAAIGNFCIDIYEASRGDATAISAGSDGSRAYSVAGVLPWQVASNAEAALGCAAVGKRLCSPAEWQLACEGPDQTTYAYGDRYNATTCNGIDAFANYDFHLTATGGFPDARTPGASST
jgi:formylglycine-generating enzyme required for sulfatase activity